ncbi:MAG: hypothetical protein LBB50_01460 [Oscillospiraceae bacterium]|jgi:hypothetical protein|nr:hypothetical protein [Oscillospiraceae bacterium]
MSTSDIFTMIGEIFALLFENLGTAFSGGFWNGLSGLLSLLVANLV